VLVVQVVLVVVLALEKVVLVMGTGKKA